MDWPRTFIDYVRCSLRRNWVRQFCNFKRINIRF